MEVLTYMWEEQTQDLTKAQRMVIGSVLAFIFIVALLAMVLLYLDVTK